MMALTLLAVLFAGAVGVIAFGVLTGRLNIGALLSNVSVERMERAIASWGAAAPLASVALMVLHSFVPFPAEMLAIANGMLFGLALGVAITWIGAMLGALLAFALARWLGQPFVHNLLGERRWRTVETWTAVTGAKALLLARLMPVISFNLVNYAAGLTGISWWTFTWTTAIGILPITIASVLVGSHMTTVRWEFWAVLVVAAGVAMLLHRRRKTSAISRAAASARERGAIEPES